MYTAEKIAKKHKAFYRLCRIKNYVYSWINSGENHYTVKVDNLFIIVFKDVTAVNVEIYKMVNDFIIDKKPFDTCKVYQ